MSDQSPSIVTITTAAHHFRKRRVLLEELDHAIGQLGVVDAEGLDLVEGQENPLKEDLVLVLQRQSEPVDDTGWGIRLKNGDKKRAEAIKGRTD